MLELWTAADAEPSHTDDAVSLAALVAHDPAALVVAEEHGRIVGSVIAAWDGWRGSIYRLVVAPSHRRQGLARRLVGHAEDRLSEAGAGAAAGHRGGDRPASHRLLALDRLGAAGRAPPVREGLTGSDRCHSGGVPEHPDGGGMDRLALGRRIGERCRLAGAFTLRSGQTSTTYFDKYLFESDPVMLGRSPPWRSPWSPPGSRSSPAWSSAVFPWPPPSRWPPAFPAAFVRKQAKRYGTAKLAEGVRFEGRRVLVVEDVITTGGPGRRSRPGPFGSGAPRSMRCSV